MNLMDRLRFYNVLSANELCVFLWIIHLLHLDISIGQLDSTLQKIVLIFLEIIKKSK